MQASVEIDEALIREAMALTGDATEKAAVERALRALIDEGRRRSALERLWGIGWTGDLDAMRTDLADPAS